MDTEIATHTPVSEFVDHLHGEFPLRALAHIGRGLGLGPTLLDLGPFFFGVGGGLIPAGGKKQSPVQRARCQVGDGLETDPI